MLKLKQILLLKTHCLKKSVPNALKNMTLTTTPAHIVNTNIKLIAIYGSTAVGKSAYAMQLAHQLDGEIISCDSMQIYRGMDIGTAKPTPAEQSEIPHHLLDIRDPDQSYSCAEYAVDAHTSIAEIIARGKQPILCGGTGFYMDAVISGNTFEAPGQSPELREQWADLTNEDLHAMLRQCDPVSSEQIHVANRGRVLRALEIFHVTGKPRIEFVAPVGKSPYQVQKIGLNAERDVLYKRAELRVDKMMADGLLNEVISLNLDTASTAAQAIGYKQILAHLRGECTLDQAVSNIKQATRNYIKRQLTWTRRDCEIEWIKIDM